MNNTATVKRSFDDWAMTVIDLLQQAEALSFDDTVSVFAQDRAGVRATRQAWAAGVEPEDYAAYAARLYRLESTQPREQDTLGVCAGCEYCEPFDDYSQALACGNCERL